ncbi:MAG: adenylate/guanylate cyclase domain-containing protein [Leptolyngbyaceae cyanobacterium CSU_1_4]|nr:adenylate/guanylate cyclase domain-containing protein [Leptolyngbyaceae cyanobacterium CSU_1_4]
MPSLYYLPDERTVPADELDTILDCSLAAGIPHISICGGNARCSTCRVSVLEGLEDCQPRNHAEQAIAKQLGLDDRIRLGCQTRVTGNGTIKLRRLTLDHEDLEVIGEQIKGRIKPHALGEEKQIAILFADLRGFTTFSEALLPYDVIYVLNRYFYCMGKVIVNHGGMINNYMGDGLMALFGCDDSLKAAEHAVRAALDMVKAMEKFNLYLEAMYQQQLKIGIGIHYGEVVIGSVGASASSQKMTAIGDAVNLASRIEAANKTLGTTLLVSEAVYRELQNQIGVSQHSAVEIPGKTGHYHLYAVMGISEAAARVEPLRHSSLSRWMRLKVKGDRFWQWLWKRLNHPVF